MSDITGAIVYKNYMAMQHANAFNVFRDFITEIKPSRILEIGTAAGGLTVALRDILNDLGLHNVPVKSFDVNTCSWHDSIREQNVEIIIENIFNQGYTEIVKPESIIPFIQGEGVTLVLCDGGYKIGEFNLIAPHIKVGDFIFAHDYVDTIENFNENYKDKIWNWCEVEERNISEISEKCNLVDYNKEKFNSVVWVCKKKVS
jgi:cephalosporin hydroxylase